VVKGKILGGAPRTGRWTRQPEERRLGGRHRGSIIALLVLGVLILGGIGGYLFVADQQLRAGLLAQEREARQRPDWVSLAELPPHLRHAFGVVVDTTFFARRTLRRGEGNPSVSRELVRQVHLLDRGLGGEARELAMAPLLELRRPRQRLLELYVNRVALGRTEHWSVFGAQQAATDFFGKDARALTPAEAATLAGILLPPRLDDPEAQPGAVGARRNEVLRRMHTAGHLAATAYAAALREPLGFQPGIEHAPMSRPADWQEEPEVIRLPEELRPRPEPAAP
jgi:membrane peptidoglycan carboxypeptidase